MKGTEMYDENVASKVMERDHRVGLMERFVELDRARMEAEQGRDECSKRLASIHEDMTSLRHELRSAINDNADDLPMAART